MPLGLTLGELTRCLLASGKITQEGLDEAQRQMDADPAIRRARRGLWPFVVKKLHRRRN
jgi:hypothetical protein